ncbi:phosphotransferase [Conexibacter woesei]|nr:phosphotransferase [Conexibacter woesei]
MTDDRSGTPLDDGWDSQATLVDGRWIDRTPRRAEVTPRLRAEVRLLGWLAPRLPLAVPRPFVVGEQPLVVRHALVPGEPAPELTAAHGRELGAFLHALHASDAAEAVEHDAPGPAAALAERRAELERMRTVVLLLLPAARRGDGDALLDAIAQLPAAALVHGDLGPEHVLVQDGRLSGVIDWSDAHVGDPAIDLAWTLHGATSAFASALAERYGVDAELRARALLWHRLGPWYEVLHGVETAAPETVASGVDGVLARL